MKFSYAHILALLVLTVANATATSLSQSGPAEHAPEVAFSTDPVIARLCAELDKVLKEELVRYQAHVQDPSNPFDAEQLQERLQPFRQLLLDKRTPSSLRINLIKIFIETPEAKEMLKQHDPATNSALNKIALCAMLGMVALGMSKKSPRATLTTPSEA